MGRGWRVRRVPCLKVGGRTGGSIKLVRSDATIRIVKGRYEDKLDGIKGVKGEVGPCRGPHCGGWNVCGDGLC